MSWLISAKQYIPAVIGEPFGGGYFAGYISHTADGNPTHALIVAPKATETTSAWALNQNAANGINYSTTTIGVVANGAFDGAANMAVFESIGIANFPAAQACKNVTAGGFADWYLPSRWELDIAYFNLKPSTDANTTSWGTNNYSVPKRTVNYTLSYPVQTVVPAFITTSQQGFSSGNYFSSTEVGAAVAWGVNFINGNQFSGGKTTTPRCRAFRKIAL